MGAGFWEYDEKDKIECEKKIAIAKSGKKSRDALNELKNTLDSELLEVYQEKAVACNERDTAVNEKRVLEVELIKYADRYDGSRILFFTSAILNVLMFVAILFLGVRF